MAASSTRGSAFLLLLLCLSQTLQLAAADGLGASNESAICVQTAREIRALLVNTDQAANGVEGGVLVANACKQLVAANAMAYRSDEAQQALCDNACFQTIHDKYKLLLDSDCFAGGDSDEQATGNLQAAAYQIACQTSAAGKYCIPMLATLVANAGTKYDLCADIVKDMGCCFQSYKQYMAFGTPASVATMDAVQQTCVKDGVAGLDQVCPCGTANAYNKYAYAGTPICSHAASTVSTAVAAAVAVVALACWLGA